MGMVEHNPGVVVLCGIGALAHIEPLNAPGQYHSGGEWAVGQHVGGAPSGNPLQADQQRELTLHRCSQIQGMAHEVQHCRRRPGLFFVRTGVPVRGICHDAAAFSGQAPAREEVDSRRAKPAIGNIR